MTEKQLSQAKEILRERGETFLRTYRAFEGDTRVISKNKSGQEIRYTVRLNDSIELIEM